ncbi:FAD-dependent monooxygenase [Chitinasiproducens palmae]|uniref:2-polyprenyl-6-methoxyphenol hydroxylase n=1 Tax=Chitinasiproducens palmae TaxID=1770053 RepID=A0A1H2PLC8_9BURK|nr:FAD-dependent monooxygenase [Chitinasiproducens palmae]SDV46875.1 2-polyprenyl-6-methoxyphenol hydroxylase [Chitinasiproducens palmae]
MEQVQVLIVGAGPTGLVLALSLARFGVRVRVIDKAAGPGTTSRALAVQARTLELYRQLDLTDAVLAGGHRAEAVNLWVEGKRKARLELDALGAHLTPFPFVHVFPQDRHERLLIERLAAAGVEVQRATEVTRFIDHGTHVCAFHRPADAPGAPEQLTEAQFIVGCDGAHSMVRKAIGATFDGGTYQQLFYVADVSGSGPALNGEVHVDLDRADFLAVFGMDGGGRGRLVGLVRDERSAAGGQLDFHDVAGAALRGLDMHVDRVNWFSTYHVHHRVASRLHAGRAFIAGDAGHVHSPAGGQGMNTGIGDAVNLAWKLAAVLGNRADEALLHSYEAERMPFAHKLVDTTDRAFSAATAEGRLATLVRTRLAPLVLPLASHVAAAREYVFRAVSQTMLNYRDGPLADGRAGDVHGGDRLPWAPAPEADNFDPLRQPVWQVHVYGTPQASLRAWCAGHAVALHALPWHRAHEAAGLQENAAYLVRPDTYVACASASGDPAAFQRYLDVHRLQVGPAPAGGGLGA